jgi:hypothetical protein
MDKDNSNGLPPSASPTFNDGNTTCDKQTKSSARVRSSDQQKPPRAFRTREDSFTTPLSKTRWLQKFGALGTSARRPRGRER